MIFKDFWAKYSPQVGTLQVNNQLYPRNMTKMVKVPKGEAPRQFRSWITQGPNLVVSSEVYPDAIIPLSAPITIQDNQVMVNGMDLILRDENANLIPLS